jgi:hypothetical protein
MKAIICGALLAVTITTANAAIRGPIAGFLSISGCQGYKRLLFSDSI